MKRIEVPIWEKANLTLEEASAYFGIGVGKLRELTSTRENNLVLFCGSRRLIKRKAMQSFLDSQYSV